MWKAWGKRGIVEKITWRKQTTRRPSSSRLVANIRVSCSPTVDGEKISGRIGKQVHRSHDVKSIHRWQILVKNSSRGTRFRAVIARRAATVWRENSTAISCSVLSFPPSFVPPSLPSLLPPFLPSFIPLLNSNTTVTNNYHHFSETPPLKKEQLDRHNISPHVDKQTYRAHNIHIYTKRMKFGIFIS